MCSLNRMPASVSRRSHTSAGLPVQEREIAQILAIMFDQVEGVEDRGSNNFSNRDKPSGPSTTASPSIVKLLGSIRSLNGPLGLPCFLSPLAHMRTEMA
jgi:hypothetical protein